MILVRRIFSNKPLNKPELENFSDNMFVSNMKGGAKMAGVKLSEKEQIFSEVFSDINMYNKMATATSPFGDGTASHKIYEITKNYLKGKEDAH